MNFLRSHILTKFPEAEKRVPPSDETKRSCTTVSELEDPLPDGGPNVLMHLALWFLISHILMSDWLAVKMRLLLGQNRTLLT